MTTLTSPLDQRVSQPHLQALRDSLKGHLHFPGDQTCVAFLEMIFIVITNRDQFFAHRFADRSKIFNGAIRTRAIALALPEDASDVSK